MTSPQRFERDLPLLLEAMYLAGTPDYRDELVRRTAATRQRPAWTLPERWLPMDITTERVATPRVPWRAIGVLALIAALLAATAAVLIGTERRLPEPFGLAANGSIVFNAGGDIFVRDTLDAPARPLLSGPDADRAVAFSPRGTRLLVAREVGAAIDLLVAAADGSDLIPIGGPYLEPGRIEWSPDETTIAIAHLVDGVETISLVAVDGSGERALEVGMPADEPTWRPPDGAQIAFRGRVDGAWSLFLIGADGSGVTQLDVPRELIEDPYEALAPAWSPTGDRIAFHRLVLTPGNGNGNGFRITIASVSPTGATTAVETPTFVDDSDDEHHPVWELRGDALLFQRRDGTVDSIAAVDLASRSVRGFDLTAVGSDGGLGFTLAPDGRAFVAHGWSTGKDSLVDLASGDVTPLNVRSDDGAIIQRVAP